jgi:hypothetical protein
MLGSWLSQRRRRASLAVALPILLALVACGRRTLPSAANPILGTPPPARPQWAPESPLMTSADLDVRLRAEWKEAGVIPTPPAPDATWLRRLWVDVAGTIPPPEVVRQFLADKSAGKRARAIDELLASPRWSSHWTTYWDDVWMGRNTRAPDVDSGAFRGWLYGVLARNTPWNEVVTQLLTATGRNSDGRAAREAEVDEGAAGAPQGVDGAVNWTLKYQENPQDMAGAASRTLLGVQIQCAQCHDHKTEKWTQKDFQAFAAAFTRTRVEVIDREKRTVMGGRAVRRVDLSDLDRPAPRFAKKMGDIDAITKAKPATLEGTELGEGSGVRVALAQWVTGPHNPWFPRALVNRMWGHFLGRGFVDPVDDLRPSNPPTAPDLFGALAADFVASGYDVKHLVRVIVGSEVYALSAVALDDASAKADPETKRWERFRVVPLGPEELFDAAVAATKLDAIVQETGALDLAQVRFRVKERYGFLFDVDEESDQNDYEGTISQALTLLNGSVVATGASILPGGALAEILTMPGDDGAKIEELYLRTVSRLPTPDEIERWTAFLRDSVAASDPQAFGHPRKGGKPAKGEQRLQPDPLRGLENRAGRERADGRARAYEDMLWTLLNSSEFVLNH